MTRTNSRQLVRRRRQVNAWLAGAALAVLTGLAGPSARAADEPILIVAFGDSLTAGFRLSPAAAFPAQLEKALKARGHNVRIENAGVSGDTTAAGLERLDWAVPAGARGVIVELGANDALRGIDPAIARRNLDAILTRIRSTGAEVLIAGMAAPRNWGEDYVKSFESIFHDLARKHDALLYPFFLDGVALEPSLNLDDGMHPNARGVARIVERIMPKIEALIERIKSKPTNASASKG